MNKFNLSSFLLGVIAVFLAVIALKLVETPAPVLADSSGGGDAGLAVVALSQNNFDLLCVVDSNKHMVIYEVKGNRMRLLTARNIEFDLTLDFFDIKGFKSEPSVKDVQDLLNE